MFELGNQASILCFSGMIKLGIQLVKEYGSTKFMLRNSEQLKWSLALYHLGVRYDSTKLLFLFCSFENPNKRFFTKLVKCHTL